MINLDLTSVGGRQVTPPVVKGTQSAPAIWWFGWIPTQQVDPAAAAEIDAAMPMIAAIRPQLEQAHTDSQAALPDFKIIGSWKLDQKRYPLWQAAKQVYGKHLRYNWQLTGSCVGAGGGNMLKTQQCVEIAQGDPEEYLDTWWPWTYGLSRMIAGMRGKGEGSLGSAWARAIAEYGIFGHHQAEGLPQFKEVEGWIQLSSGIEMEWSDGNAKVNQYKELGKKHTATMAQLKSADDCIAALANGYTITQASMFGFRSSKVVGTPQVRIAPWDGTWAHQTYVDEYWDHPTEGELFRWGNNWGPLAHGAPTGGEPPGGVYIRKNTMDRICRSGEVYCFSRLNGFPARKLTWVV